MRMEMRWSSRLLKQFRFRMLGGANGMLPAQFWRVAGIVGSFRCSSLTSKEIFSAFHAFKVTLVKLSLRSHDVVSRKELDYQMRNKLLRYIISTQSLIHSEPKGNKLSKYELRCVTYERAIIFSLHAFL